MKLAYIYRFLFIGYIATPLLFYAKTITFINYTDSELKIEFYGIDKGNVDRRWKHIRYVPQPQDSAHPQPVSITIYDAQDKGNQHLSYTLTCFTVVHTFFEGTNRRPIVSQRFKLQDKTTYSVNLMASDCEVKIVAPLSEGGAPYKTIMANMAIAGVGGFGWYMNYVTGRNALRAAGSAGALTSLTSLLWSLYVNPYVLTQTSKLHYLLFPAVCEPGKRENLNEPVVSGEKNKE